MSKSKLDEFRQLVLDDESLQKELRNLTDRKEFVARMVALGAEHGYGFTSEDVEAALQTGRTSRT